MLWSLRPTTKPVGGISLGSYDYGSLAGDYLRNSASAARNTACDIYSRFPKWAVGNVAIASPAWNAAQGIVDSVCSSAPTYNPPPQPAPSFQGGQCQCAVYRVSFSHTQNTGTPQETTVIGFPQRVRGAVKGFFFRTNPNGSISAYLTHFGSASGVCLSTPQEIVLYTTLNKKDAYSIKIDSIVREDGQPDNCGNPPPTLPPQFLEEPTAADRTPTVTVPDSKGRNINVPIYLPPDSLLDANFNLKVDVGGITFNFDAGGVSFNYGNKNSGDGSPGSFSLPDVSAPDIEPKIDQIDDKLDNALDKLDERARRDEEKDRKPPDDPDYEEDPKPPGDSSEDGVEGLKWLKTTLTKLPISGKTITKSDGQLVAYCGWLEWRVKGRGLPRIQLNYPLCIFPAPEGVDGYAVTFTNGAEGTVSVIKAKPAQQ